MSANSTCLGTLYVYPSYRKLFLTWYSGLTLRYILATDYNLFVCFSSPTKKILLSRDPISSTFNHPSSPSPPTNVESAVCILPFPALLKVTERRLRIAICCVYSIALLLHCQHYSHYLASDRVQNSIKRIMVLTAVEVTVCLVVGILPGISYLLQRGTLKGAQSSSKSTPSSR